MIQADHLAAIVAAQHEIATATQHLDEVLALTAARAQELTRATGAAVELADGDMMVYREASGSAAHCRGLRLPVKTSLSGLCVRTGAILQCDDTETDPRVDREACRRAQARSMLVVPLQHAGETVGVLKVLSTQPRAFGPLEIHTLQLLAALIATAMARATAFEALQREEVERQQIERSLRESELRFHEAFNHAPIGMALVALGGRWLKVNRSLCQMLGYTENELLALDFQSVTHPQDLEAGLECVRQLTRGDTQSFHLEKRYLHRAGHSIHVQLSVSLVRDGEGEPLYFVVHLQDIGEQKQRRLFLETLLENLADAVVGCDAQGRLTLINRATRELRGLPEEPIPLEQWSNHYDLYQSDGKTRLAPEQLPILRALREGRVGGEELVIVPKGQAPRTVVVNGQALVDQDGTKLGAVVAMHDISARKSAEEQLRAYAEELQRQNGELERALAEVQQLQGILPICGYCKSIRDDLDYWHEVESYITQRSEARFSHSVCPACVEQVVKPQLIELRPRRAEHPRTPVAEPEGLRPTILIVEDQRELRETFAEVLEEEGFEVATAANGTAALQYLHASPPPDLILLDLLMPLMTGWEFREAQRKDPTLAAIPVVVMSGLSPADQKAETLGAMAHLTKPIRVEVLLDTIYQCCPRSHRTGDQPT